MSILLVTGTSTGVGKTVTVAAIAALARSRTSTVAVVKPAQTGVANGQPGDLAEVTRMSGAGDCHELARYPDPLAPETAARLRSLPELALDSVARTVHGLAGSRDLVLVEGAGGLLVRYSSDGWTLADLARELRVPVLIVCAPGLGTLNHTALTLEVCAGRGLAVSGLVIGSWPVEPDLATRCNVTDLQRISGGALVGALREEAGQLDRSAFLEYAVSGLGPMFGGRFDTRAWVRTWQSESSEQAS